MSVGLTLDSGALIAFEANELWVLELVVATAQAQRDITIPTAVVAETWRGGPKSAHAYSRLLKAAVVEPLSLELAKAAGELRGRTGGTAIDAIVAVSAGRRGDAVVASDPHDMRTLADDLGTFSIWSP